MSAAHLLGECYAAHPYITVFIAFVAVTLVYNLVCLYRNILYARSTGLPYIVYPVHEGNVLYLVIRTIPATQKIIDSLPQDWRDYWNGHGVTGRWKVRARVAEKYGTINLAVSPGGFMLNIEDAAAANDILMSRDEKWPKPTWADLYKMFAIYGPNILVANKKEWPHHRRIVGPAFNERSNAVVWAEALQQSQELMDYARHQDLREGFLRLALHIISTAGFGMPIGFSEAKAATDVLDKPAAGAKNTYVEVLNFVSTHLLEHSVCIANGLPKWLVGKHWQHHHDFNLYIRNMIDTCREKKGEGKKHLLNLMVDGNDRGAVTYEELIGNLFIFALAGHETTAQTLHYALLMMALHPESQDWLYEELQTVLGDAPLTSLTYEETYPKLKAPMQILKETLRFFSVASMIPRHTGFSGCTQIGGHTLRKPMDINIHIASVQHNAQYWGADVETWNPRRWDGDFQPVKGSWIPFSDGTRRCIGMKFAEVEFVAVVTAVARSCRVVLRPRVGETREVATERAWRMMLDSNSTPSLQVDGSVGLFLELRE